MFSKDKRIRAMEKAVEQSQQHAASIYSICNTMFDNISNQLDQIIELIQRKTPADAPAWKQTVKIKQPAQKTADPRTDSAFIPAAEFSKLTGYTYSALSRFVRNGVLEGRKTRSGWEYKKADVQRMKARREENMAKRKPAGKEGAK